MSDDRRGRAGWPVSHAPGAERRPGGCALASPVRAGRRSARSIVWPGCVAALAPLIAPYSPNVVDVTARLLPPSARALARHRRARAGRVLAADLRRAHLAVRRLRRRGAGRRVRHVASAASRRMSRGRRRRSDDARSPTWCCASRRSSWPWRSPRRSASARTNTIIAMLVVWWPKFARLARSLRAAAAVAGICRGGRRSRATGPARILLPAHHAQRGRPADRAGDARRRQRDHHLRRPVVPRPRRRAADAGMGLDGVGRAASWSRNGGCAAFPGLAILTVVMGFNFLGDGIRDWLDPQSRGAVTRSALSGEGRGRVLRDGRRCRPSPVLEGARPAYTCRSFTDAGHRCARWTASASRCMPGETLGIVGESRVRQEHDRAVRHAPARGAGPHRRRRASCSAAATSSRCGRRSCARCAAARSRWCSRTR